MTSEISGQSSFLLVCLQLGYTMPHMNTTLTTHFGIHFWHIGLVFVSEVL